MNPINILRGFTGFNARTLAKRLGIPSRQVYLGVKSALAEYAFLNALEAALLPLSSTQSRRLALLRRLVAQEAALPLKPCQPDCQKPPTQAAKSRRGRAGGSGNP